MGVFVQKNLMLRKLSEPKTYHASIISDGHLIRERIDIKDFPKVYNTERHSILSIANNKIIVNNVPIKNFNEHHSSVSTLKGCSITTPHSD